MENNLNFAAQVRLWTIVGTMHTSWEIISTNQEDIIRVLAHTNDIRDSTNINFLYDFCTIRLYLLAYVAMIYPVFVKKKIMLMTPWMVISGLRFFQPYMKYRIIFWLMIFRYWLKLVDDEIVSSQMDDKKTKLAGHIVDKDEEAQIIELRKKTKGVRRSLGDFEIREKTSGRTSTTRDALNVGSSEKEVNTNYVSPEPSIAEDYDSLSNAELSSEYSSESIDIYYSRYSLARKFSRRITKTPIMATDCIQKQMIDLIMILANNPKEELLERSKEAEKEMMEEKRYSSFKFEHDTMPQDNEVVRMKSSSYRKPQYLLDYPGIFADKTRSESDAQDIASRRFQSMLMGKPNEPGGFDALRDTLEDYKYKKY